ncbi:kinase-like domain-containing protein, partial [Staphylotrichum tortipilum]
MAMWWDDDTIEQTVTRDFVCSRLIPQEIARLDQPLSFGDNLTDCTYWEWLDEKAKKIFLILTDLGLPDQIFGLIDDSLDDEDLPIPFDLVGRLSLTSSKDEKMERRFYYRQFHYLLRPLQRGVCTNYEDDEVVPLDVADKKLAVSPNSHIDKVTLPDHPGMVFCRCQVPIGPGQVSWEVFVSEVNGIQGLEHEHLLSYWTAYTHQGYGYVLFTPAPEYSLKSLLTTTPSSLKNLDKKTRRQTVMAWIYCLTETVAFLHSQGLPHGSIKPSTVMFTADHRVFLTGFGFTPFHASLLSGLLATDTTTFDKEVYDYSAPEHLSKSLSSSPTSLHRSASSGNTAKLSLIPNPSHCDPRAADVFALACVLLELLSFLFKKHGRTFATHRGARHKTAGRGGAVLDSSFQRNLGQVDSWMSQLARDAAKKKDDDPVFRGVGPLLKIVEQMLAYCPGERPSAGEVHARVRKVVTEACGMVEPHFVDHNDGWGD